MQDQLAGVKKLMQQLTEKNKALLLEKEQHEQLKVRFQALERELMLVKNQYDELRAETQQVQKMFSFDI